MASELMETARREADGGGDWEEETNGWGMGQEFFLC